MTVLELTDDQVLSLIGQLPSAKKRSALLALAWEAGVRRDDRNPMKRMSELTQISFIR